MNTITTLGTVDDVLVAAPEELRPLCLALRALIAELHPDATEVPRKGDRTVAMSERRAALGRGTP